MPSDRQPLVSAGLGLWLVTAVAAGLAFMGLVNGQSPEIAIGRALIALVVLGCLLRFAVGMSVPPAAAVAAPVVEDVEESGSLVPTNTDPSGLERNEEDDGDGTERLK